MTPGARVAAAIEIIDDIVAGQAAEQTLTRWARGHRFAGSKDRAAIRDHVFDVLRRWRSVARLGGGEDGRRRMIGLLRQQDVDPDTLFTGEGHAPAPLIEAERGAGDTEMSRAAALDLPDWLLPLFHHSLGPRVDDTATILRGRAPITLRVNIARTSRAAVRAALHDAGIVAQDNPLSDTALTVTQGDRRIRQTDIFADGLVELQDASSQAVVDQLPQVSRFLDYCAGGGGKTLALAARQPHAAVFAHDIDPVRMQDLAPRAIRARATVEKVSWDDLRQAMPFDLVLVDAPCSGSGAWRRAPEGKWRLTPERLGQLTALQDEILDRTADLVTSQGTLAYATCSVLHDENEARVEAFLDRHPDWQCGRLRRLPVSEWGDGFFIAHLTRVS